MLPFIAARLWRGFTSVLRTLVLLFAIYLVFVLIGLAPVNNEFTPAGADGVEIFVMSNPVHADIVMPIQTEVINWREHFPDDCFRGNTKAATHVAVGWGDRGFFLETPTWADMKLSTAANAVFVPSETCLHVAMYKSVKTGPNMRAVRISTKQYRQLVNFVAGRFRKRDGESGFQQIKGAAYGRHDAFFEAVGQYHGFYTCNSWVGSALQAAGVRVGWMTPLPKTVFLYLPE